MPSGCIRACLLSEDCGNRSYKLLCAGDAMQFGQAIASGLPRGLYQDMPSGKPCDLYQGTPSGKPRGLYQDMPSGKPYDLYRGTPSGDAM
jgi:hypothetical protein